MNLVTLVLLLDSRIATVMADLVTLVYSAKYKKNRPGIELSWSTVSKSAKLDELNAVSFFGQLQRNWHTWGVWLTWCDMV